MPDRAAQLVRLHKLTRLARESPFPAERAVAQQLADRLRADAGIAPGALPAAAVAAADGIVDVWLGSAEEPPWAVPLAYTTCKYHFARAVLGVDGLHVVGPPGNVAAGVRLYQHLARQIDQAQDVPSFGLGVAVRIRSRLMLLRGREVHGSTQALLSPSDRERLETYLAAHYGPPLPRGPHAAPVPAVAAADDTTAVAERADWLNAYAAGYAAAGQFDLTPPCEDV